MTDVLEEVAQAQAVIIESQRSRAATPNPERSTPPDSDAPAPPQPVDLPPGGAGIVTLDEFVTVDEPGAEALLGLPGDILLPEGGDVMLYGDGGAGKTTLAID